MHPRTNRGQKRVLYFLSLIIFLHGNSAFTQTPAPATPAPRTATPQNPAAVEADQAYLRENYTKYEHTIPMRDGVKLFTAVYAPKDIRKPIRFCSRARRTA